MADVIKDEVTRSKGDSAAEQTADAPYNSFITNNDIQSHRASNPASRVAFSASQSLPDLQIVRSDQSPSNQSPSSTNTIEPHSTHWWNGALDDAGQVKDTTLSVASEFGKGAITQAKDHPDQLGKDVALGAAKGAATVAIASVVGAPVVAVGAAAAGAAGGYAVVTHPGGPGQAFEDISSGLQNDWHDLNIASHPTKYSNAQQKGAQSQINAWGAIGANIAAGWGGGAVGGAAAGSAVSAVETAGSGE